MDGWQDFLKELNPGEEYLGRTERLLFRRLWGYIIGENWTAAGQVIQALRDLTII